MKKFILALMAVVLCFSLTQSYAAPKKKVVTVEFKTNIDCDHCVKKVMNFMPFQKGVKDVVVDLSTKVVTVSFDPKKASQEAVVKYFDKIDVEAEVSKPKNNDKKQKAKETK